MITQRHYRFFEKYCKSKEDLTTVFNKFQYIVEQYNIKKHDEFLAQCAFESYYFKYEEEKLDFPSTKLAKLFPKYFGNMRLKRLSYYGNNGDRVANRIYANRMGNGSERSCDGSFYKGRGYIMLTGKNNWTKFLDYKGWKHKISEYTLFKVQFLWEVAGWYWKHCHINFKGKVIQDLDKLNSFTDMTLAVNGGYSHLKKRYEYFYRVLKS